MIIRILGFYALKVLKKKIYSNADIKFMRSALKIFSFFVYTYSTHKILKNLLSVDVETGALTYDAFIKQVSSDLVKANEFEAPMCIGT